MNKPTDMRNTVIVEPPHVETHSRALNHARMDSRVTSGALAQHFWQTSSVSSSPWPRSTCKRAKGTSRHHGTSRFPTTECKRWSCPPARCLNQGACISMSETSLSLDEEEDEEDEDASWTCSTGPCASVFIDTEESRHRLTTWDHSGAYAATASHDRGLFGGILEQAISNATRTCFLTSPARNAQPWHGRHAP